VSFAVMTLCVASQRVFIVVSVYFGIDSVRKLLDTPSYMIMFRHPNSGQNQNKRRANESFENLEKFEYLGTTLTNQNDIRDEIKSRLNSGIASYHSVKNISSSCLNQKIYKD
jgi:hypothetical protein